MYKKFLEGKRVVCFDLDGTIVDNVGISLLAFQKILRLANPDLDIATTYGRVGEALPDKWGALADSKLIKNNMTVKELTENTYKEYLKLMAEGPIEPRDGFWRLMYKLREENGLKTALATNTDKSVAMQVINKLDLTDVFDYMLFGDEVKHKKPHPEIYLKVAKHFGVKPQEMLVFEDSLVGATAAQNSGASLIVVWDQQTNERLFPRETLARIPDFADLSVNLDFTADEMLENFKKAVNALEQNQQTQK